MSKPTINAKEILADIKAGMSNADLMRKHTLSIRGLESVFRKLVKSGLLGQNEVDRRLEPQREETQGTVQACPSCGFPQNYDFEECPQCGVLVSKFKEKQEVQSRKAEEQRRQEAERRAEKAEQKRKRREEKARVKMTLSSLKQEHESIPEDFKRELYPMLTLLAYVGKVIAVWGSIILAILTVLGAIAAMLRGNVLMGAGSLVGGLLTAGFIWIVYKTYSEVIQLFLDMSTSLVKGNLLLAKMLESGGTPAGVAIGEDDEI